MCVWSLHPQFLRLIIFSLQQLTVWYPQHRPADLQHKLQYFSGNPKHVSSLLWVNTHSHILVSLPVVALLREAPRRCRLLVATDGVNDEPAQLLLQHLHHRRGIPLFPLALHHLPDEVAGHRLGFGAVRHYQVDVVHLQHLEPVLSRHVMEVLPCSPVPVGAPWVVDEPHGPADPVVLFHQELEKLLSRFLQVLFFLRLQEALGVQFCLLREGGDAGLDGCLHLGLHFFNFAAPLLDFVLFFLLALG